MNTKIASMKDPKNTSPKVLSAEERQTITQLRKELLLSLISLIDPKTAKKIEHPDLDCIYKVATIISNIRLVINAKHFNITEFNDIYENKFIKQILDNITALKTVNDEIYQAISNTGLAIKTLINKIKYLDPIIENKRASRSFVFDELQHNLRNAVSGLNGCVNFLLRKNILKGNNNKLLKLEKSIDVFLNRNDKEITDYKPRSLKEKANLWKWYQERKSVSFHQTEV